MIWNTRFWKIYGFNFIIHYKQKRSWREKNVSSNWDINSLQYYEHSDLYENPEDSEFPVSHLLYPVMKSEVYTTLNHPVCLQSLFDITDLLLSAAIKGHITIFSSTLPRSSRFFFQFLHYKALQSSFLETAHRFAIITIYIVILLSVCILYIYNVVSSWLFRNFWLGNSIFYHFSVLSTIWKHSKIGFMCFVDVLVCPNIFTIFSCAFTFDNINLKDLNVFVPLSLGSFQIYTYFLFDFSKYSLLICMGKLNLIPSYHRLVNVCSLL